jgi:hypothetical protein
MTIRQSLELDIKDLLENTTFGDEYEEDNTYQFIKDQIEIKFRDKAQDDYSLSLDDIAQLINILNDTSISLETSLINMTIYLGSDSVGCRKLRPTAEEDNGTIRKWVYTIEYGRIIEVKGNYERYCTNEVSFLDKIDYECYLKKILVGTVGNDSELGYYIECYYDEETLTQRDLESLQDCLCMEDCPKKCDLIQQFLIDNTGKCVDYVF